MKSIRQRGSIIIGILCAAVILLFALILVFNQSRAVFKTLSNDVPLVMGFVKFALLASVGELVAIRLKSKYWRLPPLFIWRILIWGFLGICITFMMKTYSCAVNALTATGFLPGGNSALLKAFYTSAVMNLSFGPTFMAFHKCTDKYLDIRAAGIKKPGLKRTVGEVDWGTFVSFTLLKTIPLFWIPAHTITFMLPSEYQVIAAAALSIALGIILCFKK